MKNSFLGSGWSFPPRFTRQGVEIVSDEEDIRESLIILLTTAPGERTMRPEYGCALRKHVFGMFDSGEKALVEDTIRRAILFHEPRISVERIEIERDPLDAGTALIEIDYIIATTNNRRNFVFPYHLSEATDADL
jgi:hypothetical protein